MPDRPILEHTPDATLLHTPGESQALRIPHVLPVLPVRGVVVFPGTVVPLNIGRPRSKALLDEVMPGDKLVAVLAQRNQDVDDPAPADLYTVGVVCTILKLFRLPDGNQSIIVHGLTRFALESMERMDPFMLGRIKILEEVITAGTELDALAASVRQQANRVIELSPNTPDEAAQVLAGIQAPNALADFLAANLQAETPDAYVAEKQALLEDLDVARRLASINRRLARQLDILELQNKIQKQVSENIDRTQRRYYLQEQLRTIRRELGEKEGDGESEAAELRQKLAEAAPPEAVMKEAERELDRLQAVPPASPEFGVIRTYVQILCELPWNKLSQDKFDLAEARRILDRDHFDLDKVKRRIIEYLAVMKLKADRAAQSPAPVGAATPPPEAGGAILCFVGPPGVGKTSVGRSIAGAMGRKFIRVALGGVRDEADIRGHRRTYIGSMPGRIISEIRKAGTRNPVMMLDEVDKLASDFRGDPAAALLEVLDPAQNHTFTDHYLDVPFDLSKVLFIATANTTDTVPPALRDRMEVIELPGYTDSEKLAIARKYLVPRQLEVHGMSRGDLHFSPAALRRMIDGYTREAGVRNLERNIGAVIRALAADMVAGKEPARQIERAQVERILGPEKFEPELASRTSVPGVATGLAYTPVGGEILFIEASRMAGKGNIILTGHIGDVMKESATAAFSLVRSRAAELKIEPKGLADSDVHLHVPAGAVPKDGPSAGVAMYVALVSLLLNRPVRADVAMTGEITLRGLVLPIGGLKEKSLAALRAGIREVIVPQRNQKDMAEMPVEVKQGLKFHFVRHVDEALQLALRGTKGQAATKSRPTPKGR